MWVSPVCMSRRGHICSLYICTHNVVMADPARRWQYAIFLHPLKSGHTYSVWGLICIMYLSEVFQQDMLLWWPLLRLLNWYPIIQSGHCNFLKIGCQQISSVCDSDPEIILCMRPANERRHYIVTSSLIGRMHAHNDPCWSSREMQWPDWMKGYQ